MKKFSLLLWRLLICKIKTTKLNFWRNQRIQVLLNPEIVLTAKIVNKVLCSNVKQGSLDNSEALSLKVSSTLRFFLEYLEMELLGHKRLQNKKVFFAILVKFIYKTMQGLVSKCHYASSRSKNRTELNTKLKLNLNTAYCQACIQLL